MSERTLEDVLDPGLSEIDWSFMEVSSPPSLPSASLLPSHLQELETHSEVVMHDTTVRDTDMTTTTSEPVKPKRGARGKELDPAAKRCRGPNWTDDEKHALLMLKAEAMVRGDSVTEGDTWNVFVSKALKERHGFDRAPKSCQQQSDTLKKQYDAIQLHDANAGTAVGGISYWEMKDQERDNLKLPRFYFGWSKLMESINSIMSNKKSTSINLRSASDHDPAASLASSSQVDVHMVPPSQIDVQPEQKDFDMALAMTNTQQPPAMLTEDCELIQKIALYVDKRVEDKMQPFVSVLLDREEDEYKYREKVLAMEMENLNLRRDRINSIKMQCSAIGSVVADDVKIVRSDRS